MVKIAFSKWSKSSDSEKKYEFSKKLFTKIAKDLLGKETKKLRSNYMGIDNEGVYKNNDRILKFTYSIKDYKAALRLIGKNLNNVVAIYSVHKFKLTFKNNKGYNIYVIEMEALKSLPMKFNNFGIQEVFWVFIAKKNSMSQFLNFTNQILNGLMELYKLGIYYYDLHSDNIMVSSNGSYKLIDFGCCTIKKLNK